MIPTVVTGHSGRDYPFSFGTNAMCRVEKLSGAPIGVIFATLSTGEPPIVLLRQFVQGTLVLTPMPSEEEVGDIIDDLGGMSTALLLISAAMTKLAAPPPGADPDGAPVSAPEPPPPGLEETPGPVLVEAR